MRLPLKEINRRQLICARYALNPDDEEIKKQYQEHQEWITKRMQDMIDNGTFECKHGFINCFH